MKNKQPSFMSMLLILLALVGVGCGQGMNSLGSSSQSSTGLTPPDVSPLPEPIDAVNKVEVATVDAEAALAEAEAAVGSILSGDSINVPGEAAGASLSGVSTKSLTGVDRRLKEALDKVLVKLAAPVQRAKDLIGQARAQIVTAMSMLDPNNPAHASALQRLQQLMSRLDQFEARLGGVYDLLADKVDLLIGRLDAVIARLSAGGNPLLIIAVFELQSVRVVLVEFRDKLAAL